MKLDEVDEGRQARKWELLGRNRPQANNFASISGRKWTRKHLGYTGWEAWEVTRSASFYGDCRYASFKGLCQLWLEGGHEGLSMH